MFARHGFWMAALIAICAACGSSSNGGAQDPGSSGSDLAGHDRISGQDQSTPDPGRDGSCTPGLKQVGDPCSAAAECATCECEDVDIATKGQFRICTSKCTNHNQCGADEVCLYPTVWACVPSCSNVSDCPTVYNRCSAETGAYKFCNVQ